MSYDPWEAYFSDQTLPQPPPPHQDGWYNTTRRQSSQWHDGLIDDLPHISSEMVEFARCRACDDRMWSLQWRVFAMVRDERRVNVYACSACYEKMRRAAARDQWRGSMHAYICHVFDARHYWQAPPEQN